MNHGLSPLKRIFSHTLQPDILIEINAQERNNDHVCGGYFYRLIVGTWAQWHFTRWIRRATAYMLKVSPPPKRSAKEVVERKKAQQMPKATRVRNLLPGLLRIYLPGYTPHDVKISPGIQVLADKYTKMAIKTS